MSKTWFSEPELYLLNNWTNARRLEESMEAVREKYGQIFGKVLDTVQANHPELNNRAIHVTSYGGQVVLSKKSWPGQYVS